MEIGKKTTKDRPLTGEELVMFGESSKKYSQNNSGLNKSRCIIALMDKNTEEEKIPDDDTPVVFEKKDKLSRPHCWSKSGTGKDVEKTGVKPKKEGILFGKGKRFEGKKKKHENEGNEEE